MFDVRVATFGMSDVMVIFALPNASVAYAPNVNRCSVSRAICALVVGVVVISMPPVALILIDVSALSVSVMFVMTELISNESPGATNSGADVEIINGDCTVVRVSDAPIADVFAATAKMVISPLKYSGISKSTVPGTLARVSIIPDQNATGGSVARANGFWIMAASNMPVS